MLGRATEQLMQNPSEPSLPGFGAMAHGFFHEIKNGHTVIGHGGDTVFFHSEFDLLPQDGVGIFYNFNTRGRDNAVYGLRKALFDEFMNRYFPGIVQADPPPLASAAADARRIAGRYQRSHRVARPPERFLSVAAGAQPCHPGHALLPVGAVVCKRSARFVGDTGANPSALADLLAADEALPSPCGLDRGSAPRAPAATRRRRFRRALSRGLDGAVGAGTRCQALGLSLNLNY
jgi:hypothetical protein